MRRRFADVRIPPLYPDLIWAGGLDRALQQVLGELSSDLSVDSVDRFCPTVRNGSRSAHVSCADHVRAFHIDFWNQGVRYGGGWSPDLRVVGEAFLMFHRQVSMVEMTSRFEWLECENGLAHERSVDDFLTKAWDDRKKFLALAGIGPLMQRLRALVSEAANRPALRQLLPYTSHEWLCFSRTTGYPYTRDCPRGCPIEGDGFGVVAPDDTLLGVGNAVQAADILVANLPPTCGRAVHGTADGPEG